MGSWVLRMMGVRMVMINMGLWYAALDTLPFSPSLKHRV